MNIELSPEEFCTMHKACYSGRDWAVTQPDMATVWQTAKRSWLFWIAQRALSKRNLRLFKCYCARQHWHLLTDERSKRSVEVAEAYCRGESSLMEMYNAHAAACAAYRDVKHRTATFAAALSAAHASGDTSIHAAGDAATDAAHYVVTETLNPSVFNTTTGYKNLTDAQLYELARNCDAVQYSTIETNAAQCAWLRENCKPDFENCKPDFTQRKEVRHERSDAICVR